MFICMECMVEFLMSFLKYVCLSRLFTCGPFSFFEVAIYTRKDFAKVESHIPPPPKKIKKKALIQHGPIGGIGQGLDLWGGGNVAIQYHSVVL